MDQRLKAKFEEAVQAVLPGWLKERELRKTQDPVAENAADRSGTAPKLELVGSVSVLPSSKNGAAQLQPEEVARFYSLVRNRLRKGPYWAKVQDALAAEVAGYVLTKELASAARRNRKVDHNQYLTGLEGWEQIVYIGRGKPTRNATVRQFLDYVLQYEKESERDLVKLDQLRSMGKKLESFAAREHMLTGHRSGAWIG